MFFEWANPNKTMRNRRPSQSATQTNFPARFDQANDALQVDTNKLTKDEQQTYLAACRSPASIIIARLNKINYWWQNSNTLFFTIIYLSIATLRHPNFCRIPSSFSGFFHHTHAVGMVTDQQCRKHFTPIDSRLQTPTLSIHTFSWKCEQSSPNHNYYQNHSFHSRNTINHILVFT